MSRDVQKLVKSICNQIGIYFFHEWVKDLIDVQEYMNIIHNIKKNPKKQNVQLYVQQPPSRSQKIFSQL